MAQNETPVNAGQAMQTLDLATLTQLLAKLSSSEIAQLSEQAAKEAKRKENADKIKQALSIGKDQNEGQVNFRTVLNAENKKQFGNATIYGTVKNDNLYLLAVHMFFDNKEQALQVAQKIVADLQK